MAEYTCKKGWLLAPDPETGMNVPFFVHVRGKDIVWSINENIEEGVLDTIKNGSIVKKYLTPQINTILSRDGWEVTSFGDDRYEATKRLEVSKSQFLYYNNLSYDIYTNLNLPFVTLDDERLNITCTMKSESLDLNSASINLKYSVSENAVSTVEVHLVNPVYNFDPEREQNTEYNNSVIFIRVSGRLKLN